MKKTLKKALKIVILIILIAAFVIMGYITYSEIQATRAKEYLIKTYDFNDWNIVAVYSKEYIVDNNEEKCSKLILRECTDNKELYKKFTFITLDGDKVHVTEYKNNIFEDDYKKKDS